MQIVLQGTNAMRLIIYNYCAKLIYILTVPVTLAMLAEEHLHDKFQATAPEKPETVMPVFNHPNAFANNTTFDFSAVQESLRGGWQRLKGFFARLFNRL